jgi:hypothetical protein
MKIKNVKKYRKYVPSGSQKMRKFAKINTRVKNYVDLRRPTDGIQI